MSVIAAAGDTCSMNQLSFSIEFGGGGRRTGFLFGCDELHIGTSVDASVIFSGELSIVIGLSLVPAVDVMNFKERASLANVRPD